jgi:hypothetical protein
MKSEISLSMSKMKNNVSNRRLKSVFFVTVGFVFFGIPWMGFSASTQTIEKFNSFYKSHYEDIRDGDHNKDLYILWDLLDKAAVDYLNSTENVNSLKGLYSRLTGYQESKTSKKTIVCDTVFYNEPDEDTPTYSSKSTTIAGLQYIFCIYRFSFYLPGRLSVYAKHKGSWLKTYTFDGAAPITLYSFPNALSRGYFITLEQYVCGDRQECEIKSWHISKEAIRQLQKYEGLIDYSSPEVKTSSLTLSFTRLPIHTCEPVLGKRLLYRMTFMLNKNGKIEAKETSLTPWLDVLNEYFGFIKGKHTNTTNPYIRDKSILKKLHKDDCPTITTHNGDLVKGVGYVDVRSGDKPWHIEFGTENGRWYISKVVPITESEH